MLTLISLSTPMGRKLKSLLYLRLAGCSRIGMVI